MLKIMNQEHYDRVVAFADKKGLRAKLEEQLDWLRTYADHQKNGRCVVELHKDFAPASFRVKWLMLQKDGTYAAWFDGACVYHGDQTGWDDKGEYVDPLSVSISSARQLKESPWEIHS